MRKHVQTRLELAIHQSMKRRCEVIAEARRVGAGNSSPKPARLRLFPCEYAVPKPRAPTEAALSRTPTGQVSNLTKVPQAKQSCLIPGLRVLAEIHGDALGIGKKPPKRRSRPHEGPLRVLQGDGHVQRTAKPNETTARVKLVVSRRNLRREDGG